MGRILPSIKGGRLVFRSSCNQCECEYQFKDKNRMGLHREYFHEAVRYSCKLCEQKTEEKPNLKFHSIEVHEGERYSCNQCDLKVAS